MKDYVDWDYPESSIDIPQQYWVYYHCRMAKEI